MQRFIVGFAFGALAVAQSSILVAQAPAKPPATAMVQAPLKDEQLEQLVAPIALYPDALLAQVMMAATYPLEIVQAARWARSNPGKTGKALEDALQRESWDPSVKSLAAVPQILRMMDEKLDWTQQLGDAFLAQREDVMNAVQRLRAKAAASGQLKTTKQQQVTNQTVASKPVIVIQPTNPQTVYVPVYNPAVVYGAWPYPAYPPYPYYPAGYAAGTALAFTTGVAVGAALWGNVNWGNNSVNINVNQYNSYNRTSISNTNWQHNSVHRKGVPYRDPAVAKQYGRGAGDAAARNDFRGRPEAGRAGAGGQPVAGSKSGAARTGSPVTQPAAKVGGGQRPTTQPVANVSGGRGGSAFSDIDRGAAARASADRGRASYGGGQRPGGGQLAQPAQRSGGGAARGGKAGARGGRR